MVIDDNDGQMIFGDLGGPKTFVLQVRNPEKTSPTKLLSTGDRTRARSVKGAQATVWPTAVDFLVIGKVYEYTGCSEIPITNF